MLVNLHTDGPDSHRQHHHRVGHSSRKLYPGPPLVPEFFAVLSHKAAFGQKEATVDGDLPGVILPCDHSCVEMAQIPTRHEGLAQANSIAVIFLCVLVSTPLAKENSWRTVVLQMLPKDQIEVLEDMRGDHLPKIPDGPFGPRGRRIGAMLSMSGVSRYEQDAYDGRAGAVDRPAG